MKPYEEKIYYLRITIIGEQPADIKEYVKDRLGVDQVVELRPEQLFPHESTDDGRNET